MSVSEEDFSHWPKNGEEDQLLYFWGLRSYIYRTGILGEREGLIKGNGRRSSSNLGATSCHAFHGLMFPVMVVGSVFSLEVERGRESV